MTSDSNLTLKTFIEQLEEVSFTHPGVVGARRDSARVENIIRHLWDLLEASQRALTKALHENRIHAEAMETALTHIEAICRSSPHYYGGACEVAETIRAKLHELETEP